MRPPVAATVLLLASCATVPAPGAAEGAADGQTLRADPAELERAISGCMLAESRNPRRTQPYDAQAARAKCEEKLATRGDDMLSRCIEGRRRWAVDQGVLLDEGDPSAWCQAAIAAAALRTKPGLPPPMIPIPLQSQVMPGQYNRWTGAIQQPGQSVYTAPKR